MAGSLRKKGNAYQFEYMYKGKKYYGSVSCEEVKGEKEAKEKLEDFCAEVRKGSYIEKTYTFYEFANIWLKEIVKPNFSPTTLSAYIKHLNNRILPKLGNYKLTEITPLVINSFVNELKEGKTMFATRENKPLAKGTIQKIYNIIKAILQKAFEYDLINSNPCQKVKLMLNNIESEINKEEKIQAYDIETLCKVLKLLHSENFIKYTSSGVDKGTVIEFALKTGMRRSEIWGITWEDINYETQEIKVNKSRQKVNKVMQVRPCKTKGSERDVPIPSSLIKTLKGYYEYKGKPNKKSFVFDSIDIDNIPAWFRKWQIQNNIPKIRFHDLRHTYATILVSRPDVVDIKTVSESLGHSTTKRTLDTYAHVQKEQKQKVRDAIDETYGKDNFYNFGKISVNSFAKPANMLNHQ